MTGQQVFAADQICGCGRADFKFCGYGRVVSYIRIMHPQMACMLVIPNPTLLPVVVSRFRLAFTVAVF